MPPPADPVSSTTPKERARWRRLLLGTRSYWLCQAFGWGGLVVCVTVGGIANDPGLYPRIWAADWLAFAAAGALASHLLRIMIFSLRERVSGWRLAIWLLPRILAAIVVMWLLRGLIVVALEPAPFDNPEWRNSVHLLEMAVLLCSWSGFYLGYDYYRRYEAGVRVRLQLDAALKEAELRALQLQINPHFLFNCLNTLRALIPSELTLPREAATLLADLLRACLTIEEDETVPFSKELEIVKGYLTLQQLRFESRLRVRIEVDPNAMSWRVPPFLIQGLVENAVKFGVAPREAGGEVSLTAKVGAESLRMVISNPGRIESGGGSTGLGLKNARDRLHFLFGSAARFTLRQESADLVAAEVVIPRLQPSAAS